MRICHVTLHYDPVTGGQQVYISTLKGMLDKHGYDQHVIQPRWDNSTNMPDVIYTPRIRKVGYFVPEFDWYFFNLNLRYRSDLIRSFDLVISHYAFHYPALNAAKHLVVLSHGVEWDSKRRSILDRIRYERSQQSLGRTVVVANDSNYLHALGIDVDPWKSFFAEVRPNVFFIPNCVAYPANNPDVPARSLDVMRILVPRQVTFNRGIHLAVSAVKMLKEQGHRVRLSIVGRLGDAGYVNNLRRFIEASNMSEDVEFMGHVDHKFMNDLYYQHNITVIPSIDREGTSLAALESMVRGTPVVSTMVGGLRDLPSEKGDATPESLVNAILRVWERWDEFALRQQQLVRGTFNMDNFERSWLKVVERGLEVSPGRFK